MSVPAWRDELTPEQSTTVEWVFARVLSKPPPPVKFEDLMSLSWRSLSLARVAVEMAFGLAAQSSIEAVERKPGGELHCLLRDKRGREKHLDLVFESEGSSRLRQIAVKPVLAEGVEIRRPNRDDIAAMTELELASPVQRDDGTEVVIDHNGKQFEHEQVVRDHRWLAAFQDGRMVAVQAVAVATAPIGGKTYRLAYNHYSRSDPRTRNAGNLIYLVTALYQDIFPTIDQFASIVDVKNTAGLRLSFGTPWPTRMRRLFLPVADLAVRSDPEPTHRLFDTSHAASLLNATHEGLNLWVPRTPEFLTERERRAPAVYGSPCWRLTEHAALALWPSGERRTYRKDGNETMRTLALAIDYGFVGERGRAELTQLLCEAARELRERDITHIALFISEEHPQNQWLESLADSSDVYAICAPPLVDPAPPSGPVYTDHILF